MVCTHIHSGEFAIVAHKLNKASAGNVCMRFGKICYRLKIYHYGLAAVLSVFSALWASGHIGGKPTTYSKACHALASDQRCG